MLSRKHIRIGFDFNISEPIKTAYIHSVFYRKFNFYQKFPIDLEEDFCGWLNGTAQSYILDWTAKNFMQYSNTKKCPFQGNTFIKIPNITLESIVLEPFMPSGRYRVDVNLTNGDRDAFGIIKLYFAISDYRIEVF